MSVAISEEEYERWQADVVTYGQTIRWFGNDWGAAVCLPAMNVATPADEICEPCGMPITAGDQGFEIPAGDRPAFTPYHRECFAASLQIKTSP